MKTVLTVSLIIVVVIVSAIKEDFAEALFKAWLYGSITACSTLATWVIARLRKRRISRIREENMLRRARLVMRRKVIVREMLTEYDYNTAN